MPDTGLPEFLEVALDGATVRVPVAYETAPASRRLRLSLKPGPKARVGVPPGTAGSDVARFVNDHLGWVSRALKKLGPAGETGVAEHLAKFPWASVGGKLCTVETDTISGRPFFVHRDGEELVLFRHRPGEHAERDLRALLRTLAATTLPVRTAWLAQRTGLAIGRVTVRNQRGRWGSCSTGGAISLNWRLTLLPPALQDHVILHELAHRMHMDHSEKFWNRLAAWDPDWRENDRSLTRDWGRLMELARDERE